eukprot:jgi/Chrzof1/14886/Cz09g19170.t1
MFQAAWYYAAKCQASTAFGTTCVCYAVVSAGKKRSNAAEDLEHKKKRRKAAGKWRHMVETAIFTSTCTQARNGSFSHFVCSCCCGLKT